ncbi:Fc.00g024240.m01.CDS01 [Cosmosporella sp. VM-42]
MIAQGSPPPEDDLNISLVLDNFGPLYNESLLTGHSSIYSNPEWQSVISTALDSGMIQNEAFVHNYRLGLRASYWASMVGKLWQAHQAKDSLEALIIANDVMEEATAEISHVRMLDERRLTKMRNHAMIVEESDHTSPFLICYNFSDPTAALSVAYNATALIGIHRVAAMAMAIAGLEDPNIELAIIQLSHRIGRCIRYVRDLKPLGCCGFIHPLQMAFESCDEKQKQFIIDTLYDFEEYKGQPPGRWTHHRIIMYAKTMTGRIPPAGLLDNDIS